MACQIVQSSLSQAKILELSRDTRALKAFEAGNLPAVATKLQATLTHWRMSGWTSALPGGQTQAVDFCQCHPGAGR